MMLEQQYIELYKQVAADLKRHSATALNAHRDEAFQRFVQAGFPTRADEEYLYCPFLKALEADYGLNIQRHQMPLNAQELFHCEVSGIRAHNCCVVNDQFVGVDTKNALPEGVVLCSLSEACEKYGDVVNQYLGQKVSAFTDGFTAFNETFAQDGFFLYVSKNQKVELPLQLINILHSATDLMSISRNLIVIEPGAEIKLLVCDHTLSDAHFFAHRLTEVFVGDNAHFDYYTLESNSERTAQLSQLFVKQCANSCVTTDIISLHNGQTRNQVNIDLDGEGAQLWFGGMFVGDCHQQIDNATTIRHNVPRCTSNELFKYILDGAAVGAFSGKILVEKNSQHTEAYQTNRNICLSKEARMYVKPQLEIYADDVKCGHGATTGQLDEKALFYMRTRGIGMAEARMLLLSAFATDVLDHIAVDAVRERLRMLVEQRLRGGDSKCKSCIVKQVKKSE